MLGEILSGLIDLVQWGVKTAAEAAVAKAEEHAAILERVRAMRAARDGERTGAHEETARLLAEAEEKIKATLAERDAHATENVMLREQARASSER